jgi:CIC family chloride channel protein
VQIVGPPSVKWAIIRAGEAGLGVTEEDLLRSWKAGDVAEPAVIFREEQTLAEVLNGIAASDHSAFLVVNAAGQLTGVITMDDFRKGFQAQPLARWLLACDLMQPPPDPASTDQRLNEALTLMNSQGLDYLPVVDDLRSRRPAGLLERRSVRLQLSTELLRRQQLAEVTKNGSSPGDGT